MYEYAPKYKCKYSLRLNFIGNKKHNNGTLPPGLCKLITMNIALVYVFTSHVEIL